MTNAMNYASEILANVQEVIWKINERGGLAPNKFLTEEYERLSGQYAAIVLNVVLLAIGKKAVVDDPRFPLSEAQYASLVERAKQNSRVELAQIAEMRAAKGK